MVSIKLRGCINLRGTKRGSIASEGSLGAIERAMEEEVKLGKKIVFEPAVCMSFNSEQEAYEFYNAHSWEVRFGIKRGNKYINGNPTNLNKIYCAHARLANMSVF